MKVTSYGAYQRYEILNRTEIGESIISQYSTTLPSTEVASAIAAFDFAKAITIIKNSVWSYVDTALKGASADGLQKLIDSGEFIEIDRDTLFQLM